jgi:hypothetical protein
MAGRYGGYWACSHCRGRHSCSDGGCSTYCCSAAAAAAAAVAVARGQGRDSAGGGGMGDLHSRCCRSAPASFAFRVPWWSPLRGGSPQWRDLQQAWRGPCTGGLRVETFAEGVCRAYSLERRRGRGRRSWVGMTGKGCGWGYVELLGPELPRSVAVMEALRFRSALAFM